MTSPEPATQYPDVLTQAEAEARASRVTNCSYTLSLALTEGSPSYAGDVTIMFDHAGEGDLFLDARGGPIHSLEVNGEAAEPLKDGHRLIIPAALLRPSMTLRIAYTNDYDHTGDGFHQFIDPEDGEEYLYTNFEPFEAHRLFPCFDQPDIKATYALSVTAPAEWQVIANSPALSAEPAGEALTRHAFAPTKPFSTYLFAVVAGPYHAFHDEHAGVSLGLFCRESLVKHIDTDELFTLTKQGLDFYADFFDYPYPFGKYDQLFVPEFNAGAMENVGCVTHNEYMIFRDPPTENQRRGRAETLLHEMAHMWFGNLVTMRWWNDLWLNESFATYMAYLALIGSTRFTSAWQDFNASIKNWAYRQDQLVTTHPIAGQVSSTDETFLNFDGITYGKGASVLKQLAATIGIDGFRDGTRLYFRTYEYRNASLAEFLGALSEGSGHELAEWSKLWLETPSLNTLSAAWEADGERITRLTIQQTAPAEYPTIRPHYLELGLFRDEGGRPTVTAALPVRIDGAEADIDDARGLDKPDLVLPNYNDHAYAKIALDPESLTYLRARLDAFDDLLTRQLLWSALWNMVRDQQLSSIEYIALAREKAVLEKNTELLDSILQYCLAALGRYVPDSVRGEQFHAFFETAREVLLRGEVTGDAQIMWARSLIDSATNAEDIRYLTRVADSDVVFAGLTVDQDMRWSIATKCVGYGLDDADARIAAEKERDPSDRGQRALIFAEVSAPSPATKAGAWDKILGEGYGSLHLTQSAMGGFNWTHQRPILEAYVERYFEVLPSVFRDKGREFSTSFARGLFPRYIVEQSILDRSERVLAESGGENPLLDRILREANDDHARAIRCRAFAEAALG